MRKLAWVAILVISFTAISCNKNQKVVKQLEGDWKITSLKINGIPDTADYSRDRYHFEKCKVKKTDCEGYYKTVDPSKGEVNFNFTYNITDDGTKINIMMDLFGFSETTTATIKENTGERFVWEETYDGDVMETTIEKI